MTEKKSDITKRLILEAAEEEFSEKGLYGARVDVIASRAGINKGMLYQYFGNKEELYKRALESVYIRLEEPENLIIEKHWDFKRAMEEIVRTYFNFLKDNPNYVRMVMWENLHYGRYFQERELGNTKLNIRVELDRILQEGRKEGLIKENIDAEQIFLSLIALSFNYFSNIHTLSAVLKRDLQNTEEISERISFVAEMLVSYAAKE